jgi:hypothetical protein
MKDLWYNKFDVQASILTVYCTLEHLRWFWKIASKHAKEQSEALRSVYLAWMAQHYTAEQIVAVDKLACNKRTSDRKYDGAKLDNSRAKVLFQAIWEVVSVAGNDYQRLLVIHYLLGCLHKHTVWKLAAKWCIAVLYSTSGAKFSSNHRQRIYTPLTPSTRALRAFWGGSRVPLLHGGSGWVILVRKLSGDRRG